MGEKQTDAFNLESAFADLVAAGANPSAQSVDDFAHLASPRAQRLQVDGPFYRRVAAAALGVVGDLDGVALLAERARTAGLSRSDPQRSLGGSAQLVAASDGWFALNLARPSDRAALPALLGQAIDPWDEAALATAVSGIQAATLDEQARLLAVPAAAVPAAALGGSDVPVDEQLDARDQLPVARPALFHDLGAAATRNQDRPVMIVDFTSMWAGPLCAALVARSIGATGTDPHCVKVEGVGRPDGARGGPAAFFDRLNGDKECVEINFDSTEGREQISDLVEAADVVLEGSRPRVFERLDIDPAEVARRSGGVWISLTAFGRTGPWRNRVGFGDDVAAAAGVVTSGPRPSFVGDALADPVGGLVGAAAVALARRMGRSCHIDLSLREAVAFAWGDSRATMSST